MSATTVSPSRPSSFFSHRYSDSMVPSPTLQRIILHARLSIILAHLHTRDTASQTMTFSTPSPAASREKELVRASTPRRSSHGDMPADTAATGVKYACASCIRGHRTSSCTHQDGSKGPLQPFRSKGRPPTQCEICRKEAQGERTHVSLRLHRQEVDISSDAIYFFSPTQEASCDQESAYLASHRR